VDSRECPACFSALPHEPVLACPHCHHLLSGASTEVETGAHTREAKHRTPLKKRCANCECDVADDRYRIKAGAGKYLCSRCADQAVERARRVGPRVAMALTSAAIIAAAATWILSR
jgi:hypothetical protein